MVLRVRVLIMLQWRALVLAIAVVLSALPLRAESSEPVLKLADRLANSSDFRVRTQAALALGASKDKKAVGPLCKSLEDSNTTVRAAGAAALGKLGLGGSQCLEERLSDEENASVKSVIEKAIARLSGSVLPGVSEATRYYVVIAETIDKTGRKNGQPVTDIVRTAMISSAASSVGYAVAPAGETVPQAKAVLTKHKHVKAYYLWPKVNPPDYAGGNLTIRFEISIFTYPSKALKGTIPLRLTMPDVSPGDLTSEDDLIRMAASKAFEKFTQNAARIE